MEFGLYRFAVLQKQIKTFDFSEVIENHELHEFYEFLILWSLYKWERIREISNYNFTN